MNEKSQNELFGKFPKDLFITLNAARSKDRYTQFPQNQGGRRTLAGVSNYNVSLKDWIQWAIDNGLITFDSSFSSCEAVVECLSLVAGLNIQVDGEGSVSNPWILRGYGVETTPVSGVYRVTRPNGTFFNISTAPSTIKLKKVKYVFTSDQSVFSVPIVGSEVQLNSNHYLVFWTGQLMDEGPDPYEWQLVGSNIIFNNPIPATPEEPQKIVIHYMVA